jgi:hypothetical protein
MTEEEKDMFNSLLPGNFSLRIGDYARYREGIGKADVKILSISTDETGWTTYELEVIGNGNWGMSKGEILTVGKKDGFEGYCGWNMQPLVEMN